MTVYDVVLFLHITAAMTIFASLTVDWLAIAGLRVTWTAERGRIWIRALEVSAAFGVWARLTVLGQGFTLPQTPDRGRGGLLPDSSPGSRSCSLASR